MILRNSRISSISLSAIDSPLVVDFSIAHRISSLIACPRADRTAESCWMISRTPASSSIIWMTPRICHSMRRRRSDTRFFWAISLIFICFFWFRYKENELFTYGSIYKNSRYARNNKKSLTSRDFANDMAEGERFTPLLCRPASRRLVLGGMAHIK